MFRAIPYFAVLAMLIFANSQSCDAGEVTMLVHEVKGRQISSIGSLSVVSTFRGDEVARKCDNQVEHRHGIGKREVGELVPLDGTKLVSTKLLVRVTTNLTDTLGDHTQHDSALVCCQWRQNDDKKELFSFHVMDYSPGTGWVIRVVESPKPDSEKALDHPPSDADLSEFVTNSDFAGRDFGRLWRGDLGCVLMSLFVEDCPLSDKELRTMLTRDEADVRMQRVIKANGRSIRKE
jgi:hypothetical protein